MRCAPGATTSTATRTRTRPDPTPPASSARTPTGSSRATAEATGAAKTLPVGVLLMDYEVHGWDLARATGQAVPFEDGEALRALETGRQMLKPEYRGPDKEFGAEVPVPDDASPMDQLVAFLGRDPGWTPPSA